MSTIRNDLRLSTIALWGGLALVLVLVGAVWIEAYYHFLEQRQVTAKVVEPTVPELVEYQEAQGALLDGYRWIDREAGVLGLPIERAMQLVAEEQGGATQ